MNNILLIISTLFGLIPWNRLDPKSLWFLDYALMLLVPIGYFFCYYMVTFGTYGIYQLETCDSVCRLANVLFTHLGAFLYITIHFFTLLRRKSYYIIFDKNLKEIDQLIQKCQKIAGERPKFAQSYYTYYFTWAVIIGIFVYDVFYDVTQMMKYYQRNFIITVMITTFPYFVGSVVQGQFLYYVSVISIRFKEINGLFEKINRECDKKNAPVSVFDIESEMKKSINEKQTSKPSSLKKDVFKTEKTEKSETSSELSDTDNEDDSSDYGSEHKYTRANDGGTSETNLPDLFKLHDRILCLSELANSQFGPQCVPYMAVCFVIGIYGIFLQTKVIFIIGPNDRPLDYVATMYVLWSLTMIVVAYLVLRLCCNANGHSKQSAMIVHEIMQKKPTFMLGNDLYYNKMKSFTLQFLHWEGYFQFNGIGLFTLDYTFIFSTVSAATSYLIVLLQFDMSSILKSEGLLP